MHRKAIECEILRIIYSLFIYLFLCDSLRDYLKLSNKMNMVNLQPSMEFYTWKVSDI